MAENTGNGEARQEIRIVIADDHAVLLESLSALMSTQSDFKVVGKALDGATAVRMVQHQKPEVLVLDLFMPDPDGFEVLRMLERAGSHVASVVLTASESQLDYVHAVKLGARGLVLKGDSPDKLFTAIRTAANGELAFSSDIADQVVHAIATEPRPQDTTLTRLSEREKQIAYLVARGMKNRDIGNELKISENTVKRHLQSIFNKTGTRDRLELAVLAVTELSRAA